MSTPPGETITANDRWQMLSRRQQIAAAVAAAALFVLLILVGITLAAHPPRRTNDDQLNPGYVDCLHGYTFAFANDQTGGRTQDEYIRECLHH